MSTNNSSSASTSNGTSNGVRGNMQQVEPKRMFTILGGRIFAYVQARKITGENGIQSVILPEGVDVETLNGILYYIVPATVTVFTGPNDDNQPANVQIKPQLNVLRARVNVSPSNSEGTKTQRDDDNDEATATKKQRTEKTLDKKDQEDPKIQQ